MASKKRRQSYEIIRSVPFNPPQFWTAGSAAQPVGTHTAAAAFPTLNLVMTVNHIDTISCTEANSLRELIYFRQETLNMFTFLANTEAGGHDRLVNISGPPGSGKSLTVIAYVSHRMSAASIQQDDAALFYCLQTGRCTLISHRANATTVSQIECDADLLYKLGHNYHLLYVVIDGGLPAQLGTSVVDRIIRNTTALVFYTCSFVSSLPGVVSKFGENFYAEPWEYTDYQRAIADTRFFDEYKNNLLSDAAIDALNDSNWPVTNHTRAAMVAAGFVWTTDTKEYILREKFVLGGHSARWMFCYSVPRVLQAARKHVIKVTNGESLMSGLI